MRQLPYVTLLIQFNQVDLIRFTLFLKKLERFIWNATLAPLEESRKKHQYTPALRDPDGRRRRWH